MRTSFSQALRGACNPSRRSLLEPLEQFRSRAPMFGAGFENQPGVDGQVGLGLLKIGVGPFMARRCSVGGVGHQCGTPSRDSDYARPCAGLAVASAAFPRGSHPPLSHWRARRIWSSASRRSTSLPGSPWVSGLPCSTFADPLPFRPTPYAILRRVLATAIAPSDVQAPHALERAMPLAPLARHSLQ